MASYRAAERLLADGRARAIGVCNHTAEHLRRLVDRTGVVPAVNQVELHPYFTQREVREAGCGLGVVTQSWSPLGGVNLYWEGGRSAAKNPLDHPTVHTIAARHGRTPTRSSCAGTWTAAWPPSRSPSARTASRRTSTSSASP